MAAKTFLKTALTIFAISILLAHLTFAATPMYEIIDLGTLGGRSSSANAINDVGQVVGWAGTADGLDHAFLWDPINGMIDLGTIPGHIYSFASAINDYGVVVGSSDPYGDQPYPFIWDPVNGMRYLDGLGLHDEGSAYGINNVGQVVGCVWWQAARAFLWDSDNGAIDLGTLGGDHAHASAINNAGKIVGNSETAVGDDHAFLWDTDNGMRDLGTLGGRNSKAYGINDAGHVVGWAETVDNDWHAFLWDEDAGMIDLGPGIARSINNAGQVVGDLSSTGPAFYLDSNVGMIPLSDLLPPDWRWQKLRFTGGINNRGQIVGEGITTSGKGRAFLMTPGPPKVIYVDDDAAGANDGSSWSDAFNYLQDALAIAYSGDEIRVAQGIYKSDQGNGITPGDREATFQLINGVTIKGGYAGCGLPDPNARDIDLYETILSGDLDGNDVEPNDPYDLLIEPSRAENSFHVVTASQVDEKALVSGFTVMGGNANRIWYFAHEAGGGLLVYEANLIVNDCTFKSNSARYGGGMFNERSSLTLTNCKFIGNSAKHEVPDYYGSGGAFCDLGWGSFTKLSNCVFTSNSAEIGGGISIHGEATVVGCKFYANSAFLGGGVWCQIADLRDCTFTSNYAYGGGGIFISDDTILTNCIFKGNIAWCTAGARAEDCDVVLTNCTFVGNLAYALGGIWNDEGDTIVTNCILWGNMDYWGTDEPAQIATADPAVINYSCIQEWTGTLGGTGNIGADPCFVSEGYWDAIPDFNEDYWYRYINWTDGDYHLLPGSPCIDAGDTDYVAEPNETDLDGRPRVIGGRIDMGAYEYSPPIQADVRIVPRTINLASKGKWLTCYIQLPEEHNVADINPNSIFLEDEIRPEQFSVDEQQQVATARFTRKDVLPILDLGDINLKITGQLTDDTVFEAKDTIKVINKADNN